MRLLLLTALVTWQSYAQVNILTANGNNDRTNANLQEVQLSPSTVTPSSFGKLGVLPVDGQVYAQPLFVSGLQMPDGNPRNVVFVSTMHNSVYAFDADAMWPVSMLWQVSLGTPVPAPLLFGPYGDIDVEVGILSTGAIDLQRGVLYVVADTLDGDAPAFYLHALDLATGAERLNGPVRLAASVAGTGSGAFADGTLPFDPQQHLQRPGLLLVNDSVYIGFGSHGDQDPYHGWMLRYDASDLGRQLAAYVSTPSGNGGSFWQSGRGPAADQQGNIYAVTGNGDYDGINNFGQSFVKMTGEATAIVDSFTPSDWKSMSENDFDLSAGPALITGTHIVVGADKGGNLYLINGNDMRRPEGARVFAAAAGSIFNFAIWSREGSAWIYAQGQRDPVMCFQVTGASIDSSPVSTAIDQVQFGRIGMTVSANGSQEDSGILWETLGDYNSGTPGALHAYDASNLANELWNSDMNQDRDQMPPITKFVAPTVANGKVYVPGSSVVVVYGLLPAFSQATATMRSR